MLSTHDQNGTSLFNTQAYLKHNNKKNTIQIYTLAPYFLSFFFVARVVKKKEDRKQGANVQI